MLFIDNLMVTLKRLKTSVSTVDGTLVGDGSGSMVVYCCGVSGLMCAFSNLFKVLVVVVQDSQESKLACCNKLHNPLC